MVVRLTARSSGGASRGGGIRLPTAADVPTVRVQSDPGVSAPAGAFDQGGAALADVGQQMADMFAGIAQRQRTRDDTIKSVKSFGDYQAKANDEIMRWQTEEDASDPATLEGIGSRISKLKQSVLENYTGSEAGRQRLEADLEREHTAQVLGLANIATKAQTGAALDLMSSQITAAQGAARSRSDISRIGDDFAAVDEVIDRFAPVLTAGQETEIRTTARKELVKSAFQGAVMRGDVMTAKAIYDEMPGFTSLIDPGEQRAMAGQIAQLIEKRNEGTRKAAEDLDYMRIMLGREPTVQERVGKVLGQPPAPMTEAGKIIADRARLVAGYGENSPQVAEFDRMTADAPALTDEAGMRKEFSALSESFIKTRDAYKNVEAAATKPSAAGDVAIVYGFMKMLDPGSAVLQGEQATAQNAAGVPARIRNVYNRMVTGETISPDQRADFLAQARNLFGNRLQAHMNVESQFRALASRKGMNPDDIALDYVGNLRPGGGGADTWTPPKVPARLPKLPGDQAKVVEGKWYQGPDGPIIFRDGEAYGPN